MTDEESKYLSFLLRLWRVDEGGGSGWRASLHCPLTGERKGFADLDALITYLEQLTDVASREIDQTNDNS